MNPSKNRRLLFNRKVKSMANLNYGDPNWHEEMERKIKEYEKYHQAKENTAKAQAQAMNQGIGLGGYGGTAAGLNSIPISWQQNPSGQSWNGTWGQGAASPNVVISQGYNPAATVRVKEREHRSVGTILRAINGLLHAIQDMKGQHRHVPSA